MFPVSKKVEYVDQKSSFLTRALDKFFSLNELVDSDASVNSPPKKSTGKIIFQSMTILVSSLYNYKLTQVIFIQQNQPKLS